MGDKTMTFLWTQLKSSERVISSKKVQFSKEKDETMKVHAN